MLYDKYDSVHFGGEGYGSRMSRRNRCSFVLAKWPAWYDGGSSIWWRELDMMAGARYDGGIDVANDDCRPGVVHYFIK